MGCEIFVTQPSVGQRTRMDITSDTTAEEIITKGRKALGLDQAWIPDSDWYLYNIKDESTPLKGKMGDLAVPWGPEGTELHLIFQPNKLLSLQLRGAGRRKAP